MSQNLQFRLVDAFAEKPFSGNPAGVILDGDGLDEKQIKKARESWVAPAN